MKCLRVGLTVAALAAVLASGPVLAAPKPKPAAAASLSPWSAAWAIAPLQSATVARPNEIRSFGDVTVRQIVRLNLGGDAVRLRLTNELGDHSMKIGAMTIALASADGQLQGAPIPVTFGGKTEASMPPGAPLLSDPIIMRVKALEHVSISTFFVEPTTPAGHRVRLFVSPQGNHTGEPEVAGEQTMRGPGLISGVEVRGASQRPVIVAIGDSITEGARSTPDANMGWPEQLAARIAARCGDVGVINVGISGGRLLREGSGPSALTRFDRDVLSVAGLSSVVVLEGINDIGRAVQPGYASEAVSAAELIAGYRQLIARAHARGVKIYGGTLLPFEGAMYFHSAGEMTRLAVNAWMRTSGEFDGVIDFEAAMKDPTKPSRMLEGLHSGDFLHPGDGGYGRMAEVADKALFGAR